jgi:ComF family protein
MPLLGMLLPRRCAGCERPGPALCGRCVAALRRLGSTGCERCGAPGPWPVRRCVECAGRRLAFATARAAVAYNAHSRSIVAAWKEQGRRDLGQPLAHVVADCVAPPAADCLVWVPGDPERGLRRGHVPAEQLGRALAHRWALPTAAVLARRRRLGSRRQAGLSLVERRVNVRDAFVASESVPGRVCLVDDVYTTGATVAACAAALRRAGSTRVDVVCLARAVR